MDPWLAFLRALWLFLPCYMANMTPVAAARVFPRWDAPLDGGRTRKDGKRLLGPNKTWRGLATGSLAGGVTAAVLAVLADGPWADLDFGRARGVPLAAAFVFGAILGSFALAGDAAKSWFKRRRGKAEGASWFPFDQLDFVAGGLLGAFVGSPVVAGWSLQEYFGDTWVLAVLVVMTPVLHLASSVLAYWTGLKKVPW